MSGCPTFGDAKIVQRRQVLSLVSLSYVSHPAFHLMILVAIDDCCSDYFIRQQRTVFSFSHFLSLSVSYDSSTGDLASSAVGYSAVGSVQERQFKCFILPLDLSSFRT